MKYFLFLGAILLQSSVLADARFYGFGTIAAGKTISGDRVIDGYDHDLELEPNSLFGFQASNTFGDKASAVVQVITRGEDDWDIDFDWAYLSYKFNDSLSFNLGHQRIPFFNYSEYIDVGYAIPWIEPPSTVYGVILDTYTGLSSRYQSTFFNVSHSVDLIVGKSDERVALTETDEMDVTLNNVAGVSWSATKNLVSTRISYFQAKGFVNNSPLLDALYSEWDGTGNATISREVKLDGDTVSFAGIAINYEGFEHILATEYTLIDYGDSIFQDEDRSFYIMAGHRINDILFHVTVGAKKSSVSYPNLTTPLESRADTSALISETEMGVDMFKVDRRFHQVGVRYDTDNGLAIKAEYKAENNQLANSITEMLQASVSLVF